LSLAKRGVRKMLGKKMRKTVAGVVAAAWVVFLSVEARADTHFVSLDGSDEYPYLTPETAARSIQAAVDAAEPGDTVEVLAGEYLEQVRLKERLCLRGAGPGLTTIQSLFPPAGYAIQGAQDARIQDLSVTRNEFQRNCGGIFLPSAPNQVVDNCAVSGPFGSGISCDGPVLGAPSVIVRSSVSGAGVGVGCWGFAVLDRCTFEGNSVGAETWDADVVISGCDFVRNTVGIDPVYTDLTVESTRFMGGEAAISQDEAGYFVHLTMVTSLISGAKTAFKLIDRGQLTLVNCTLSDNDIVFDIQMETAELVNCIVWGNAALMRGPWSYANLAARHSDVQGGWEGEGNIDADPRFLNSASGDYRLRQDSPCIDAGTTSRPSLPPLEGPSRDLEGKRMPAYGGRTEDLYAYPDMGAYEYYLFTIRPDEETGNPALIWASFYYYGITYAIWCSENLINWRVADPKVQASDGPYTTWVDDGSKTGVPPSLVPHRFYRVLENP
jgi:hypothetical protein